MKEKPSSAQYEARLRKMSRELKDAQKEAFLYRDLYEQLRNRLLIHPETSHLFDRHDDQAETGTINYRRAGLHYCKRCGYQPHAITKSGLCFRCEAVEAKR